MKVRKTKVAKIVDMIGWALAKTAVGLILVADWYDVVAPIAGQAIRRKARSIWLGVKEVAIWIVEVGIPIMLALWRDICNLAVGTYQMLTDLACLLGMLALAAGREAASALSNGWEWRKELYREIGNA